MRATRFKGSGRSFGKCPDIPDLTQQLLPGRVPGRAQITASQTKHAASTNKPVIVVTAKLRSTMSTMGSPN